MAINEEEGWCTYPSSLEWFYCGVESCIGGGVGVYDVDGCLDAVEGEGVGVDQIAELGWEIEKSEGLIMVGRVRSHIEIISIESLWNPLRAEMVEI